MSPKIKFSVVTPTFNRADTVARCIESVASQIKHGTELEHLLVDDGSTDGTDKIIITFADKHPQIKFIRFDSNRGVNAARNEAIRRASGEYIILLDSDDYFCPEAIASIDSEITAHPGYLHYLFVPDDRIPYLAKNNILAGKTHCEVRYQDFLMDRVGGDFIHVVSQKVMKAYPFEEQLRIYEGLTFLKFYKKEKIAFFCNQIVAIRERGRKDSVSKEYLQITKDAILKNIRYMEELLRFFGEDLQKFGAHTKLEAIHTRLFVSYIFHGGGKFRKEAKKHLKACHIPWIYKVIFRLRLGRIARYSLSLYLYIKYYLFNMKIA